MFPIIRLLVFNIAVLTLGPIILILLVVWKDVVHTRQHENGRFWIAPFQHSQSPIDRRGDYHAQHAASSISSRTDRLIAIWAHSKFWVALVVTLALQALLIFLYTVINPFVSSNALVIPAVCLFIAKFRQFIHLHILSCSPSCALLTSHSISFLPSQPHCHSRPQNHPSTRLRKINMSLSFTCTS